MTRKCNCAGGCGPQDGDVSRRDFLGLAGVGAAGLALGSLPLADAAAAAPLEDLERWKKALFQPAPGRVYRSDKHTDARLHLGGIGTGNFEIGADGQLTTWQLFNTLRDGVVPFHFAVRAGRTVKLLQTTGGPDVPRVQAVEMTGEYPFATLRYQDAALPVRVELTAFSPFAPLDSELSSLPLACFVFRVHNPTGEEQEVSLAALVQNPVGYDAVGVPQGAAHPAFGSNVNEPFRHQGAAGLVLRAAAGKEPTLDRPVTLITRDTLAGLNEPPPDRPANLHLQVLRGPANPPAKPADPARTLLWLEDAGTDLPAPWLRAARAAVEAGATLVLAGRTQPLLKRYADASGGKPLPKQSDRPDILFEDFEHGYAAWKVEGEAFGKEPAHGTLPNQQPVSGFRGQGLVNTYLGGDDTTGRLVSKPFTVERAFIRFLVGGGSHGRTQIRLVIKGKVVRATAGRNEERLLPAVWDVAEFRGQTAHIEIVDSQKGPWGHINIDHIEFTDDPGEAVRLLEDLLPGRFREVRSGAGGRLELVGLELHAGARKETGGGGLEVLMRPLGKGKVVVVAGPLLDPREAGVSPARQRAYATLCELAGAKYMASEGPSPKAPGFGTLALAALAGQVMVLPAAADVREAWEAFAAGRFLSPDQAKPGEPTPAGRTVSGGVAATVQVPAGQAVEVPFLFTWHYPNKYNPAGTWMGCHYATRWPDAAAVLKDAAGRFAALREKTERFRRAVHDSTLPTWMLDCLTSQAAIIRHVGVVFRIANGDVYGWEGSNGCCQPTCTHVWGYEQTLARLFPDLERDMRRIDFKHQQRPDGGVNNRTDVPSPPRPTGEHPFADGHASTVLKAYREALNSPDETLFKDWWPHVKQAVEYLVARDAAAAGGQPVGCLQDDQWNTYDEALHGVTTFISGYYLAALRAGEEWARRVGEPAVADRFRAVFKKGQDALVSLCWNGEYFQQKLDDYLKRPGEVGPGCMADQLIGQWWAHQLGLGYILPREKVQAALRAVFQHNWKPDLTGWKHMPRAFAGARDKGLIICTWPKGGRPGHVMLYSDEVWTGIEYQVAAHMLYEGQVEEAFAIVKGARDRYDGVPRPPIPRNPWNEIECGGHYARAMSSWSLLLAASGYEYDGPAGRLRFTPRLTPAEFRSFFCGPEGWGSLRQTRQAGTQTNEVRVAEGRLRLASLMLAPAAAPGKVAVALGGKSLAADLRSEGDVVVVLLKEPIMVTSGQTLSVTFP